MTQVSALGQPHVIQYAVWVIAGFYLAGAVIRPAIYAGLLAHLAYMLSRGITLGRLPLVGVHDTLNFLALSFVAFGLGVMYAMRADGAQRRDTSFFLRAASLMAALFTAFAATNAPKANYLPPVLKTYWFELHVALSFFSYALFGLAAILGVMFLIRGGKTAYERLEYKTALIGYAMFSISMIFGGVWAHLAWGTYWLWTPKELWTSLTWVYYSLYLHMRLHPSMAGRPAAILGIAGYGVVLFTYLGVSLLMKSSHSF